MDDEKSPLGGIHKASAAGGQPFVRAATLVPMWWRERLDADGIDLLVHEQGGIVSRSQLLAGGWTDHRVRRGLRTRRWQSVFPGVYATFTGALGYQERTLAALLYAGSPAMWSHYTAAEQQGLIAVRPRPVHITVPLERRVRPQHGLVIHRSGSCLRRADRGVPPRSSAPHAVLDIVDIVDSLHQAAALVAEACQSGRVTVGELDAAMTERARLRHRRELGPILADVASGTHSLLEMRYLRDVERRHCLPRGVRQRAVDRVFNDVMYPRHRLVVELDGRLHMAPGRRWRDMDRDNRATLRSEATLRYGWLDVTSRPCQVAAQVLTMMRRSGLPDNARPCGPHCPVTALP